jgi:ADP-heptose:LPS heptosyltransferase
VKKIDYYLGFILSLALWPFAFFIRKIIKGIPESWFKKKIVILKLLGGGSLVMAYPSILSIRKKYPEYKLTLICFGEVKSYAELLNIFDEIICIDKRNIYFALASSLKALFRLSLSKFVINFEIHSKLSAVFTMLLLGKKSIGLYFSFNTWQKYFTDIPIFYNPHTPVFKGYESLAKELNAKIVSYEETQDFFQKKNNLKTSKKNTIIIAPFCSNIYKEREFLINDWQKIIKEEKINHTSTIYLVGASGDIDKANILENSLKKNMPNNHIINLAGKTNLSEVLTLLSEAKKIITIDSGILHLARLIKTKTKVFWGPSNPELRIQKEDPSIEENIYKKLICSPCVHLIDNPPCNGNNLCMKIHIKKNNPSRGVINWVMK